MIYDPRKKNSGYVDIDAKKSKKLFKWDPNLNPSGGTSRRIVHERYHDDGRGLTKRTDAAVVGGIVWKLEDVGVQLHGETWGNLATRISSKCALCVRYERENHSADRGLRGSRTERRLIALD